MNENLSSQDQSSLQIDSESLSYALLISNVSVLVIGVILIGRACINTSEGDFLDAGFDEEYNQYNENKTENMKEDRLTSSIGPRRLRSLPADIQEEEGEGKMDKNRIDMINPIFDNGK